ncbi:MAG: hypothetical protein KAW93_09170 [Methanogenium sp.]|nr:hypothetical protein [Methanogenium sp.]
MTHEPVKVAPTDTPPIRSLLTRARLRERAKPGNPELITALSYFEKVITLAGPGSRDLQSALAGAARIYARLGQVKLSQEYKERTRQMKVSRRVVKQLFIPKQDLLQLPYLRKHQLTCGSPDHFKPKKQHFGHQALIAAAVWCRRSYSFGPAEYYWTADVYWLKDYDPPFSYEVYQGDDSHPHEAVRPEEVMEAVA